MKTSQNGISLIKKHEGCKLTAYLCPAKVWTIGYGHTGADVFQGKKITAGEAEEILKKDLERFEIPLSNLNLKINQNQFDALASFCFNVGFNAFYNSTLCRIIKNNPTSEEIKTQFLRWNKAGGKELAGLTKRRIEESELYFKK